MESRQVIPEGYSLVVNIRSLILRLCKTSTGDAVSRVVKGKKDKAQSRRMTIMQIALSAKAV